MAYTVKKLAKLSGVTIRTLRFYDEIGLLKPAYYGDNNYRYYEEEQLLMLQQILFFRELGFSLDDVKRIVNSSDFNKITALNSHKQVLKADIDRRANLINTIDKTIAHLRGEINMKDEELYYGFDSEKQKNYEKELIEKGWVSEKEMQEYRKIYKKYTQEDWERFQRDGEQINNELVEAINKQLKPSATEVQRLIRRHHAWVGWNPTKEKYIGLSQLYQTPEFRKFYDRYHSKMVEFMVEAMKIFAENEL